MKKPSFSKAHCVDVKAISTKIKKAKNAMLNEGLEKNTAGSALKFAKARKKCAKTTAKEAMPIAFLGLIKAQNFSGFKTANGPTINETQSRKNPSSAKNRMVEVNAGIGNND